MQVRASRGGARGVGGDVGGKGVGRRRGDVPAQRSRRGAGALGPV